MPVRRSIFSAVVSSGGVGGGSTSSAIRMVSSENRDVLYNLFIKNRLYAYSHKELFRA
jgi:hypothetical protein